MLLLFYLFSLSVLTLKCRTPLDAVQWKTAILESMNGVGRIWLENHPYGSSFPVRRAQSVQWLSFFFTCQ